MNEHESLYIEYKYDLEELISFIKTLLNATENEYNYLTNKDMEHNIELVYNKLITLHDKLNILTKTLSEYNI